MADKKFSRFTRNNFAQHLSTDEQHKIKFHRLSKTTHSQKSKLNDLNKFQKNS